LIAGTKDEKAGKAAVGAISTRTEPGLPRRTQRRPSGTLEAVTGGAEGLALAAKMGNSIERANALHRTYAPADEVAVQSVDELDCSVGGNFAS